MGLIASTPRARDADSFAANLRVACGSVRCASSRATARRRLRLNYQRQGWGMELLKTMLFEREDRGSDLLARYFSITKNQ
jgi:hypothetical protein